MSTGCSFVAPGLTATISGQVPIFSYRPNGHSNDNFGVQMTYLTGSQTCYGAAPNFTPYITNSAENFSKNCIWGYRSIANADDYTALLCPVSVTDIPDGPLTITYRGAQPGAASPRPFIATFGESPAVVTVTNTATATSTPVTTTTATPLPAATATATATQSGSAQTVTVRVTQPVTSTSTVQVSSCSAPSSSSVRPSSSSSPSPSPRPSSSSSSPAIVAPSSSSSSPVAVAQPSSSRVSSSSASLSPAIVAPSSSSSSSPSPGPSSSRASSSSSSPSPAIVAPSSSSSSPVAVVPSSSSSARPSSSTPAPAPSSTPSSSASPSPSSSPRPLAPAPSSSSPAPAPSSSSSAAPVVPSSSSRPIVPSSSSPSATPASATPSLTPSIEGPSCPSTNGTTIRLPQGDFLVECFVDRYNFDLAIASPQPANYEGCIEACAANSLCEAASYIPNGACYLKNGAGTAQANQGVWGIRRLSGPAPSVSASSVSATPAASASSSAASAPSSSSAAVSCPGSNNRLVPVGNKVFQVECYVDRNTLDLSDSPVYPGSYEGCLTACADRPACKQVSYSIGGPCYLKSGSGDPVENGGIIGGRLLDGNSNSTAPPTLDNSCPSADGRIYTTQCGATYEIECASDRFGGDIPDIPVPQVNSLGECLEACDKTSGCIDVSYVNGTPGPCYLKNTIVPIRPNSNIWGGRQLTGCKTTTQATVKLHRKRVVNEKRPILPRGIPIGPDYTFFSTTTTVTRTSTYFAAVSTTTVTPARSGTTTTTVQTTASPTVTTTQTVFSITTTQTMVTSCPTAARF